MTLHAIDKIGLDEIVALAKQQTALEAQIEEAETALSRLKARHWDISTEALPMAMAEVRLKKYTLASGESIDIKHDFNVGIPEARRPEAFAWLEEKGYGGIIKTLVAAEFGKGELERAQALFEQLQKKKFTCELKRDVHWQTLKAFINESARENRPVPLDLFGATPMNKATIKAPKSKEK